MTKRLGEVVRIEADEKEVVLFFLLPVPAGGDISVVGLAGEDDFPSRNAARLDLYAVTESGVTSAREGALCLFSGGLL